MAYYCHLWHNNAMKKIILASSSPRRIEMMKKNGYEPLIIPADINEEMPIDITPPAFVMYLSLKKALHVKNHSKALIKNDWDKIIAADTIVLKNNNIIGKPCDEKEAFKTLSLLRNSSHHVLTGVCIIDRRTCINTCFYDITKVYFKDISDDELTAYVNTPEPYDKAGGYAIHQTFSKYLDRIEGDFNNVIGLPWYKVKPFL